MAASLAQIAERLEAVQSAADELAADYEARDERDNPDASGSRPQGKRWDELQAGTEQLATIIGDAVKEARELQGTYTAELGS